MNWIRPLGHCVTLTTILCGCASSPTSTTVADVGSAARTTTGFRVFQGDCLNTSAPNLSPLLVPLFTNVVSGGLKAVGGALKRYGDDTDERFASTLNFNSGEDLKGCLHVVHGEVFTDSADFQQANFKLEHVLPLPWEAIARANAGEGATSMAVRAKVPAVLASAKEVLASSGAMLAAKPKFFAELRAVRSADSSSVAFRLRSFYYAERLSDSWLSRSTAKAIVLTVSGFDVTKSLLDNLKSGYSVSQSDVPVGKAWVTSDLLHPKGSGTGRDAWDSPWFSLPTDKQKPFTVVAGLLETTAGSKLLGVLGTALESSAESTAKGLADVLDSSKQDAADAAVKTADLKAKSDAAAAVVKALADVGKAKDAQDACVAALTPAPATADAVTKAQRDALLAFVSAKITAAASIAGAEPLFSEMQVPVTFLDNPGACVFPS